MSLKWPLSVLGRTSRIPRPRHHLIGHVEAAELVDRSLRVEGWALSSDGAPVTGFEVRCGGRTATVTRTTVGIASPDVEGHHPGIQGACRARFALDCDLPSAPEDTVEVDLDVRASEQTLGVLRASAVRARNVRDVRSFHERYTAAASEVLELLRSEGIGVAGKAVADIGCGDGVTALGVMHAGRPERLVGFDILPVDRAALAEFAERSGMGPGLPAGLTFKQSAPARLPGDDAGFDVVYSWSALEHVEDVSGLLAEVRRVLRPTGTFMIQIWPLYYSQHGAHLSGWFPEGFVHLCRPIEEVLRQVRARSREGDPGVESMLDSFQSLNRMTVDDLHIALVAAGFRITKAQLLSEPTRIPPDVPAIPLSRLCTSGVKLLAVPA